jgi:thiol-disulfide isomerase/thioredoxin
MNNAYWLLAILIAASAFGLFRRWDEGRTKVDNHRVVVTEKQIGAPLGEKATLLQFSSAFCAPCRTTKVVLSKTASIIDGVSHVEIDAESHLELVRTLEISRTPTTLILDKDGMVRNRAVGVPRQDELISVLAATI